MLSRLEATVSRLVSVVVSVHKEVANSEPLMAGIGAAPDGHVQYEVIYVDEGSDDGTAGRQAPQSYQCPDCGSGVTPSCAGRAPQSSADSAGAW